MESKARPAPPPAPPRKRRWGWLLGILVGGLLVAALDFGGEAALARWSHVKLRGPLSLRAWVALGMIGGIGLGAVLLFFLWGLHSARETLGGKVGFFRAVGRGIKHFFQAAWAVGLTFGVVGGTAWFLVPPPERRPAVDYVRDEGRKALDKTKTWAEDALTPAPKNPPPPKR